MPALSTVQDHIKFKAPIPVIQSEDGKWHTLYAVAHCRGNRLGKISHGSMDGDNTLCGKYIVGGNWYITHNEWDGPITCPACLKIIRDTHRDHPELL